MIKYLSQFSLIDWNWFNAVCCYAIELKLMEKGKAFIEDAY